MTCVVSGWPYGDHGVFFSCQCLSNKLYISLTIVSDKMRAKPPMISYHDDYDDYFCLYVCTYSLHIFAPQAN